MKTDYKNDYILVLNCKVVRQQQDDQLDTPVKLRNILRGIWELSCFINNSQDLDRKKGIELQIGWLKYPSPLTARD